MMKIQQSKIASDLNFHSVLQQTLKQRNDKVDFVLYLTDKDKFLLASVVGHLIPENKKKGKSDTKK